MDSYSPQLLVVPPQSLMSVWPSVRRWILSASTRSKELDERAIVEGIAMERFDLFVVKRGDDLVGAFTTQFQRYPLRTVLQILHLGGKFDLMHEVLPELVKFAKANGASAIREYGRKGWVRKLAKLGFFPRYYVMEKEI